MLDWHLYVIRCGDGTLYTGISTDVVRRFEEHISGGPKAAKYLRGRGPLVLVYSVQVGRKSSALKLERWVKALPRVRKDLLVAGLLEFPHGSPVSSGDSPQFPSSPQF